MTLPSRASFSRPAHLLSVAALTVAVGTASPLVLAQTEAPTQVQTPVLQIHPQVILPTTAPDRAGAYYHYGLAHLYEDMAVNAGRPDYATQAVEEYKLALNADPGSTLLQNGLAELYFKIGRVREAVSAAQEQVAKNPKDVEAHTLLGRVYVRSLGDMQGPQSTEMLQLAIKEYETITQLKPDDIESRLLLGQLYGLNHDSAKAEATFKAAQKIDGGSEEVVLNMARLYTEQGENQRAADTLAAVPVVDRTSRIDFALGASYDLLHKPKEAAAAYRAALEDDPENTDALRGLASALQNAGELDEALKIFQQIATAEPQDAQTQIHTSEIQRNQGHYEDALATLKKAKTLNQDKDNPELGYNEALIYDSLGRYDEATAVLNGLLTSGAHPDGKYSDPEKLNRSIFLDRLGIIYREQNKTAEAVGAYKQLGDLGGDYSLRGIQGQVDAYRDAHQWKDAVAVAAAAAKAYPKDRGVQLMYAGLLADTGKADEGLALATAQLNGTPDDRNTEVSIANIDIRVHRSSDALGHLAKAEALITNQDEKLFIYLLRATLADHDKQYDEAEREYRKALTIDPQNATVLNDFGYMLADRGVRLDEATRMVEKAVELDPQNGAYLDSLGWVYFKTGKYALAEQNLRKAIDRVSTDPSIHDHLGEVYEKTGRLKLAVAQWERSMTEYAHSLPIDADPDEVAKVQHKLDNARVKLARLNPTPGKKIE